MTHAHTLWFFKTKVFNPRPKNQNPKFVQVCKFCFYRIHSDRSTGSRPALDRHAQMCMCVSVDRRSTDTLPPQTCCSLEIASRPTQSTGEPQRSDFRPLAVDRPGRPVVCQKFWQTQQLYFLTLWLLGFVSNESLEQFLTPINRWSLHMIWLMILELSSEILQKLWKDFQSFQKKRFFSPKPKFHTPYLEPIPLLLSSFALHNPILLLYYLVLGLCLVSFCKSDQVWSLPL